MNMLFGGLIGVASAIGGLICTVAALVMLVVYPWQLVWFIPTVVLVWVWLRHKAKRASRKSFKLDRDWSMLYPEGFTPAHRTPMRREHTEHLVEPVTIGGHIRRTHHSGDHA